MFEVNGRNCRKLWRLYTSLIHVVIIADLFLGVFGKKYAHFYFLGPTISWSLELFVVPWFLVLSCAFLRSGQLFSREFWKSQMRFSTFNNVTAEDKWMPTTKPSLLK